MSSPQRRAELRVQQALEEQAREQEEDRLASLTLWERIEEADIKADLKAILHILAKEAN